jgi:hypothetical protein
MRILTSSALIAASLTGAALLGGCSDRGYGYGGVEVGYNASWGDPYWGWYGDYYYPGTGYYVYDRQNRRHRWNDGQRGYWEGRSQTWRGARREMRPMWRDYGVTRDNRGGGRRRR